MSIGGAGRRFLICLIVAAATSCAGSSADGSPQGAAGTTSIDAATQEADPEPSDLLSDLPPIDIPMSNDDGVAFQRAMFEQFPDEVLSVGTGTASGVVEVVLAPDAQLLADALVQRYGDSITVDLGRFPHDSNEVPSCWEPPTRATVPGLEIRVVDPLAPVTATGVNPMRFQVTVKNVSSQPILFESGTPALGIVLDLAGNIVSDGAEMNLTGVGIDEELQPGDSLTLDAVASVASCEPSLGPRLPPGRYKLIALLEAAGDTRHQLWWSEPIEFTLDN